MILYWLLPSYFLLHWDKPLFFFIRYFTASLRIYLYCKMSLNCGFGSGKWCRSTQIRICNAGKFKKSLYPIFIVSNLSMFFVLCRQASPSDCSALSRRDNGGIDATKPPSLICTWRSLLLLYLSCSTSQSIKISCFYFKNTLSISVKHFLYLAFFR